MSTLLTWSGPFRGTASAGTTAADTLNAISSSLAAAGTDANFPWEVCSSDLVDASVRYVTLKRKTGGAGRIVFFMNVSSATLNPVIQLAVGAQPSHVRVIYVGGATSDTPANLFGAGAIFTGQVDNETTPATGNPSTITTGNFAEVYGNEDFVVVGAQASADTSVMTLPIYMAGLCLVSNDDAEVRAASFMTNNLANYAPSTAIGPTSYGFYTKDPSTGTVELWGLLSTSKPVYLSQRGRDNVNKRVYFYGIQQCSFQPAYGAPSVKFQIRQMSDGVPALAPREVLTDVGSVVRGFTVGGGATPTFWAVNVKLNV